MATHPIGKHTVNRTTNLPIELDKELGKIAFQADKSKSQLLREWAEKEIQRIGHDALVGLFLMTLLFAGICQVGDRQSIRRPARGGRRLEQIIQVEGGVA